MAAGQLKRTGGGGLDALGARGGFALSSQRPLHRPLGGHEEAQTAPGSPQPPHPPQKRGRNFGWRWRTASCDV